MQLSKASPEPHVTSTKTSFVDEVALSYKYALLSTSLTIYRRKKIFRAIKIIEEIMPTAELPKKTYLNNSCKQNSQKDNHVVSRVCGLLRTFV